MCLRRMEASKQDMQQIIDPEEWGVGIWAANPDEQVPEIPDATKRLAVIDLDWTKVESVLCHLIHAWILLIPLPVGAWLLY